MHIHIIPWPLFWPGRSYFHYARTLNQTSIFGLELSLKHHKNFITNSSHSHSNLAPYFRQSLTHKLVTLLTREGATKITSKQLQWSHFQQLFLTCIEFICLEFNFTMSHKLPFGNKIILMSVLWYCFYGRLWISWNHSMTDFDLVCFRFSWRIISRTYNFE